MTKHPYYRQKCGDNYRFYARDTRVLTTTVATESHIIVYRQYLYNHGSVL